MLRRIYTVDDDYATINLWLQFEADGTFPGVTIDGSDNIALLVEDVVETQSATLYVLDSRLPIADATFERFRTTILSSLSIDIEQWRSNNVLNGLIAAVWVKLTRSDCKVVLITAFHNTIRELGNAPEVGRLIDRGCDGLLGKPCSKATVASVIEQMLGLQPSRGARVRALK